ncbi:MAG: YjbQ family protein [Gammaproteobacteria bacterium]|nr:YjbQ family protein [Gammaproteobacteria bacterium]
MIQQISIKTGTRGLHEITDELSAGLNEACRASGIDAGLCTVFIPHTSASLLIQENADPSCRRDLERWLHRLVPENDPMYTHTQEGPDDMPSHIKSMLTATTVSVPFVDGRLALGTWQGIFLWEHRTGVERRRLFIHIGA